MHNKSRKRTTRPPRGRRSGRQRQTGEEEEGAWRAQEANWTHDTNKKRWKRKRKAKVKELETVGLNTGSAWPATGHQRSEAFWTYKDRFTKDLVRHSLHTNTWQTNTKDNKGRTQYSTAFTHTSGRDRTNLICSFIHALTDHHSSLVLGLSPFPITLNVTSKRRRTFLPRRKKNKKFVDSRTLGICNTEPRNTC